MWVEFHKMIVQALEILTERTNSSMLARNLNILIGWNIGFLGFKKRKKEQKTFPCFQIPINVFLMLLGFPLIFYPLPFSILPYELNIKCTN